MTPIVITLILFVAIGTHANEIRCPNNPFRFDCNYTVFEPMCAFNPDNSVESFPNSCIMLAEHCPTRHEARLIMGHDPIATVVNAAPGLCPGHCDVDCRDITPEPVCASNCHIFRSPCEFAQAACWHAHQGLSMLSKRNCTTAWTRMCDNSHAFHDHIDLALHDI